MLKLDSWHIWIFYIPQYYVAVHIDSAEVQNRENSDFGYIALHYGGNIIMGAKQRKTGIGTILKDRTKSSILLGNKDVGKHAGLQ